MGDRRAVGAAAFLLVAALAYPGGMGMGDVKLALLIGAGLGKVTPVGMMIGFLAALVPSAVLIARHGQAARKMAIPFGPFLAFGAVVALFAGEAILHLYLSLSWLSFLQGKPGPRRYETRCPPNRHVPSADSAPGGNGTVEARRRHARRHHGRARAATRFRMPLVDLAVVGINPEATKLIPLRCSSGSARSRSRSRTRLSRIAITDPENVHAIDELRLATRHACSSRSRREEDVLLEIRRLSRANEAFSSVLDDDLVPVDDDRRTI